MDTLDLIMSIAASLTLSVIVAYYGAQRKIGFLTTFLISAVLSPLVGVILVLVSPKNTDDDTGNGSCEKRNKEFDLEEFRKN